MHVLVTGGAGYIGAHVVDLLLHADYQVSVIDNLSTGIKSRLDERVNFHEIDIRSESMLDHTFSSEKFNAVIHLAAKKSVSESFLQPEEYNEVNHIAAVNLMNLSRKHGCKRFIFSSTAAVYGNGTGMRVRESDQLAPISPYGESKARAEEALGKLASNAKIRFTALRYFNIAGAKSSELRDQNLSNLIPIVIDNLKKGLPPRIFGEDYDTKDGTCVRDYVHVSDIAAAHLKCLEVMDNVDFPSAINIGSSKGYSVREVIECAKRVLESSIEPVVSQRRSGDPAELLADNELMRSILSFVPKFDLESIIRSLDE
jgi:UDP-glucose 4-epimerase